VNVKPISLFLLMVKSVSLSGCSPSLRFSDRAILWREPDDAPIPLPKTRDPMGTWLGLRDVTFLPADRALALDYGREAVNVNALDEVPDSSWYVDPRRVVGADGAVRLRPLGAEALARGRIDGIAPEPPLTVVKGKSEGANLGFVVKDARGVQYELKIDPPGLVGLDTSTEAVVSRLVWAAGWLVPDEALIDFQPGELRLAPDAKLKDPLGRSHPFTQARLDEVVAGMPRAPGGTIRAVASRWIEGKIVGPSTFFGLRNDDANDRVPHENRRDLRAFGIFSEWVNNIDTLENNTLDAYVGAPGRGHLLHYQQDVGGAFGSRAVGPIQYWMGTDVYLAPSRVLASLFTLGAWPRRWEGERVRVERARLIAAWPELGFFDAEHFDPRHWHPVLDNPAFVRQTARDRYWGMKRILAFTPEELRAAIAAGRYRPAAAERLFDILWRRRERMARAFLADLPALDHFRLDGDRLCFDDLWLDAGLGGGRATAYGMSGAGVTAGLHRCAVLAPKLGYRIVALRVRRPGERGFSLPVRVHIMEEATRRRILGIER
jgi:hypothetical protein